MRVIEISQAPAVNLVVHRKRVKKWRIRNLKPLKMFSFASLYQRIAFAIDCLGRFPTKTVLCKYILLVMYYLEDILDNIWLIKCFYITLYSLVENDPGYHKSNIISWAWSI